MSAYELPSRKPLSNIGSAFPDGDGGRRCSVARGGRALCNRWVKKRSLKIWLLVAWLLSACLMGGQADGTQATLNGGVFCGYQGWFRAEGDGSALGWVHYGPGEKFAPGHCAFDLWPDLAEFSPEEKYPAPFRFGDGRLAHLFSSMNPLTVRRHFRWMREYGIDGAFVQRFGTMLTLSAHLPSLNAVLKNCTESANAEGRSLTVMYDLSGLAPEKFDLIALDWEALVEAGQLKQSCAQQHEGRPLVALWGLGFRDRSPAFAEWRSLIGRIKATGCAVMVGLPCFWRELKEDAWSETEVHNLIREADVVSPWTVGRCNDPESVAKLAREVWQQDMKWCNAEGKAYLPVIFPGFSWHNLSSLQGKAAPLNQIPRLGGRFFWSQAVEAKKAGARSLYVAMFDEIDEGTAVMKCGGERPAGASPFVDLSDVPSDHYLWLSKEAGRMLRGESPVRDDLPSR